MPNIKLNYRYRDYANYKNHGEVIFANPDNLSLEAVEAALRAKCMDDEYFYASQWGLKDLHFDKYVDEHDHPWHEFEGLMFTDEEATEKITARDFLAGVKDFKVI